MSDALSEIKGALLMFAAGLDSINQKVDGIAAKVDDIAARLDTLVDSLNEVEFDEPTFGGRDLEGNELPAARDPLDPL